MAATNTKLITCLPNILLPIWNFATTYLLKHTAELLELSGILDSKDRYTDN